MKLYQLKYLNQNFVRDKLELYKKCHLWYSNDEFMGSYEWSLLLQHERNWETYQKNIANDTRKQFALKKLQQEWKPHAKFSHYTSDAVLCAADILAGLEYYLQTAQQEYQENKHKLSKADRNKYRIYFKCVFKYIKKEQKGLCAAMYARWQLVFSNQNIHQDNITQDLLHRLVQLNSIKHPEFPQTNSTSKNTLQLFVKFFHYMYAHGSTDLKLALERNLDLKKPDGTELELSVLEQGTAFSLVPSHLKAFIPLQPKTPAFIFKGRHLRYHFFQNKGELFLELLLLSQLSINSAQKGDLSKHQIWKQLQDSQHTLNTHLKLVQNQRQKSWRSIFMRETEQFLLQWESFLLDQQDLVTQYKTEFLIRYVKTNSFDAGIFEKSPKLEQFEEQLVEDEQIFLSPACGRG